MTSTKKVHHSAGKRPPAAGKGRPKGAVNKFTKEIKDMISQALHNVGGVAYLEERANDPKTQAAFLGLVGKAMPLQVQGDKNNPMTVTFTWKE